MEVYGEMSHIFFSKITLKDIDIFINMQNAIFFVVVAVVVELMLDISNSLSVMRVVSRGSFQMSQLTCHLG